MSNLRESAERVLAWREQYATLGGLNKDVVHVANLVELKVSDLMTLVDHAVVNEQPYWWSNE